ncbi:hypothetical protein DLM76_07710 [Leptospira yasudae]|uniref:DUF5683 domain-containing protein n=1 Tax=Leptospira yasudae TaxID=2202201 RepID=A0ABX9M804_9LEPT|nr:DUF5683 domain-containing protein [Leptospira yasudae]RHX82014.1 hypothetical protein DLM77_00650 [Leptospira yasudae]RHX95192.1 hypothetical protein DLM76_07710 [Leptospira yasudae]TGK30611.1 hypothetical protein EHQ05_06615 [Leptospira yasudae]TGM04009.1 hypothetical protein EHQ86_12120 [Leptospira yasudae]
MSAKSYFPFFFLFLFLPTFLSGESIILKDGTVIKGRVSAQNAYNVTVKTEDGKSQDISKVRILKIVYKDVTNEEALRIKKEEEAKLAEKEQKKKEQDDKKKAEEESAQKVKEEKQKQEMLDKQAKDADAKKKEEERLARVQQKGLSPWSVAWRSAVLPGWGQWTDERKTPAIVYSALFVSSLYLVYRENQIYKNSVRDLNHMNNPYETLIPVPSFSDPAALYLYSKPFEDQRDKVNQNYRNLQLSMIFAVLVYAANIFDAYYFHPRFAKSAASHLILDYNPMARLDSNFPSNSSSSIESFWKLGFRFHLE